jgi:hypothetical protein
MKNKVEERIRRNEDAIFRIEARNDIDFWNKQERILWHQKRIVYWLNKLEW